MASCTVLLVGARAGLQPVYSRQVGFDPIRVVAIAMWTSNADPVGMAASRKELQPPPIDFGGMPTLRSCGCAPERAARCFHSRMQHGRNRTRLLRRTSQQLPFDV